MKKLLFFPLMIFAIGCEKGNDNSNTQLIAKIVGFDFNCSTCILYFPYDSSQVIEKIGNSDNSYYQTVNLNKNDFEIGQLIKVNVRKAEETELRTCMALYPSYNYQNVYVTDYEYLYDFEYGDTIDLGYGNCLNDYNNQITFCFDSVITDSRCPENVICIWAGEAIARFSVHNQSNEPVFLDLPIIIFFVSHVF